jgi:hypothetical protein
MEFTIQSETRINSGLYYYLAEEKSREGQKESWKEVLTHIVCEVTGGDFDYKLTEDKSYGWDDKAGRKTEQKTQATDVEVGENNCGNE